MLPHQETTASASSAAASFWMQVGGGGGRSGLPQQQPEAAEPIAEKMAAAGTDRSSEAHIIDSDMKMMEEECGTPHISDFPQHDSYQSPKLAGAIREGEKGLRLSVRVAADPSVASDYDAAYARGDGLDAGRRLLGAAKGKAKKSATRVPLFASHPSTSSTPVPSLHTEHSRSSTPTAATTPATTTTTTTTGGASAVRLAHGGVVIPDMELQNRVLVDPSSGNMFETAFYRRLNPVTGMVELHQRYHLRRILASTLQGFTSRVYDRRDECDRCVKVSHLSLIASGRTLKGTYVPEDFSKEIRMLRRLSAIPGRDTGFAAYVDDWVTTSQRYLAIEYCSGGDLFEFTKHYLHQVYPSPPSTKSEKLSMSGGSSASSLMATSTPATWMATASSSVMSSTVAPHRAYASGYAGAYAWPQFKPYRRYSIVRSIFSKLVRSVFWLKRNGVCHMDLSLENTLCNLDLDRTSTTGGSTPTSAVSPTSSVSSVPMCAEESDGVHVHDDPQIKIIDFGVSQDFSEMDSRDPRYFRHNKCVGKTKYQAPEVYDCKYASLRRFYDASKADVWCLGVMLFMMIFLRHPYQKPSTRNDADLKNLLAGGLREWVARHHMERYICPAACDLLMRIFTSEAHRITIEQVVTHPFVADLIDFESLRAAGMTLPMRTDSSVVTDSASSESTPAAKWRY